MIRFPAIGSLVFSFLMLAPGRAGADDDRAANEFFEKEVRPILANRCQKCHGPSKQKGGLRLDSRGRLARGRQRSGRRAGKPRESLLIDAVNYGEVAQMPPKSKLPASEIAALTKWVESGVPWPADHAAVADSPTIGAFDLQEARSIGAFNPSPIPPFPRSKTNVGRSTTSIASSWRSSKKQGSSPRSRPIAGP